MGYGESSYGSGEYEATAQTHYPEKWIERMCSMLEIPVNHQIVRLFTAWGKAEGGEARWNPLNTVNHIHSSAHGDWQSTPDWNSTGVANYNHPWQGIVSQVDVFNQPAWVDFIKTLRKAKANGTTAEAIVNQWGSLIQQRWGTTPATLLGVLKTIP